MEILGPLFIELIALPCVPLQLITLSSIVPPVICLITSAFSGLNVSGGVFAV